ncbi:MAG: HNH endonuclease [Congregibacter sp.]
MQAILKLDLAGQPRGWLTLHEAVTAYARGSVVYGIGDALPPVYGGIQRLSGERSRLDIQPIIALEGRIMQGFTPPLCNRTLFRRDDHRCLYCGAQHNRGELTRDHVLPVSRGGTDRWENVVAACKRCNWKKDSQTPEEAKMPLLAVPFRPNTYEWHFLAKDRVLADQMGYLSQQFRAHRNWANDTVSTLDSL